MTRKVRRTPVRFYFFVIGYEVEQVEQAARQVSRGDTGRPPNLAEPANVIELLAHVDPVSEAWVVTVNPVLTIDLVEDALIDFVGSVGRDFVAPLDRLKNLRSLLAI